MASAIDDWPVGVLVSLKRGWRSPLEAYTLCLASFVMSIGAKDPRTSTRSRYFSGRRAFRRKMRRMSEYCRT